MTPPGAPQLLPCSKEGGVWWQQAPQLTEGVLYVPVAVDYLSVLKSVCVLTCPLHYPYRYICRVPYEMLASGKPTRRRAAASPPLTDTTICHRGLPAARARPHAVPCRGAVCAEKPAEQ